MTELQRIFRDALLKGFNEPTTTPEVPAENEEKER